MASRIAVGVYLLDARSEELEANATSLRGHQLQADCGTGTSSRFGSPMSLPVSPEDESTDSEAFKSDGKTGDQTRRPAN